jgi:hypothetical protein
LSERNGVDQNFFVVLIDFACLILLLSIDVDSVSFFLDLIDVDANNILKSIDSELIVALPEKL